MKFLCPSCDRLSDIGAFRAEAGALLLRCARCGEENRHAPPAAAPAPAASPAPRPQEPAAQKLVFLRAVGAGEGVAIPQKERAFEVPEGHCPKCVSPVDSRQHACAHCGLVPQHFRPEEHLPNPPVAKAWAELLERWQDNDAHDKLLQLCVAGDALAAAGRLYRIQLAYNPEDPFAARGRDEVLRLATAANPLMPSERRALGPSKRWQVAAFGLGVVLFVALLVAILKGSIKLFP